jgi:hypothetical protein
VLPDYRQYTETYAYGEMEGEEYDEFKANKAWFASAVKSRKLILSEIITNHATTI